MEIKRGGVYYIDNPTFTGHEMAKDRPAVVVSCAARRPSLSGKTTGKARSAPSRAWWYMSTRRGGITP